MTVGAPLLEAFLAIVKVGAVFFWLAWLVAREHVSPAARWRRAGALL